MKFFVWPAALIASVKPIAAAKMICANLFTRMLRSPFGFTAHKLQVRRENPALVFRVGLSPMWAITFQTGLVWLLLQQVFQELKDCGILAATEPADSAFPSFHRR